MEQKEWIVYLCLLLSYLMPPYTGNRYLQVLRNTVGLNLYLGLFVLCKIFCGLQCTYKLWQGRQLFDLTVWTHSKKFAQISILPLTKIIPNASSSTRLCSHLSPTCFLMWQVFTFIKSFPFSQFDTWRNLAETLLVLAPNMLFLGRDWATSNMQ